MYSMKNSFGIRVDLFFFVVVVFFFSLSFLLLLHKLFSPLCNQHLKVKAPTKEMKKKVVEEEEKRMEIFCTTKRSKNAIPNKIVEFTGRPTSIFYLFLVVFFSTNRTRNV